MLAYPSVSFDLSSSVSLSLIVFSTLGHIISSKTIKHDGILRLLGLADLVGPDTMGRKPKEGTYPTKTGLSTPESRQKTREHYHQWYAAKKAARAANTGLEARTSGNKYHPTGQLVRSTKQANGTLVRSGPQPKAPAWPKSPHQGKSRPEGMRGNVSQLQDDARSAASQLASLQSAPLANMDRLATVKNGFPLQNVSGGTSRSGTVPEAPKPLGYQSSYSYPPEYVPLKSTGRLLAALKHFRDLRHKRVMSIRATAQQTQPNTALVSASPMHGSKIDASDNTYPPFMEKMHTVSNYVDDGPKQRVSNGIATTSAQDQAKNETGAAKLNYTSHQGAQYRKLGSSLWDDDSEGFTDQENELHAYIARAVGQNYGCG